MRMLKLYLGLLVTLFAGTAQASTVATGSQPIHEAAVGGHLFKVRSLLRSGAANKNARDHYNNTPLILSLAAPPETRPTGLGNQQK